MGVIHVCYRFGFDDGGQESFDINIDEKTLELIGPYPEKPPAWTALDFHQCPMCPLSIDTHAYCPMAAHLANIVERFNNVRSFDKVDLEVIMDNRISATKTTAQRAISSLMGLVIATSGCPVTSFFKPMARFHLPMANEGETLYRAASTYLLAQYFACKQGNDADLELDGLTKTYTDVQMLNVAMARRLRDAINEDASVNAVICLDVFAKAMPYAIEDSLEPLRVLFNQYLDQP